MWASPISMKTCFSEIDAHPLEKRIKYFLEGVEIMISSHSIVEKKIGPTVPLHGRARHTVHFGGVGFRAI
jgi:hypothetical protein